MYRYNQNRFFISTDSLIAPSVISRAEVLRAVEAIKPQIQKMIWNEPRHSPQPINENKTQGEHHHRCAL
jgi:hypothetical protein